MQFDMNLTMEVTVLCRVKEGGSIKVHVFKDDKEVTPFIPKEVWPQIEERVSEVVNEVTQSFEKEKKEESQEKGPQ